MPLHEALKIGLFYTGKYDMFDLILLPCCSKTTWIIDTIAGTSFDAAESGPPPLHSVRCPDHFSQESFPQELKVRRLKMH